jgi:hypothetical protein
MARRRAPPLPILALAEARVPTGREMTTHPTQTEASLLVIDKVRRFFHRRIEPQILMSVFSVFMPSGDLDSNEDFVGVNLFDGAFFLGSVNVDPIAGS